MPSMVIMSQWILCISLCQIRRFFQFKVSYNSKIFSLWSLKQERHVWAFPAQNDTYWSRELFQKTFFCPEASSLLGCGVEPGTWFLTVIIKTYFLTKEKMCPKCLRKPKSFSSSVYHTLKVIHCVLYWSRASE